MAWLIAVSFRMANFNVSIATYPLGKREEEKKYKLYNQLCDFIKFPALCEHWTAAISEK